MRRYTNLLIVLSIVFVFKANAGISDSCLEDAKSAINSKDFIQAGDILRGHYYYMPVDTDEQFLLARTLSWQGQMSESLEHFNSLLKTRPDDAEILLARANTYRWMGNESAALQDLEAARKISPDYIDVWRTELSILAQGKQAENTKQAIMLADAAGKRFPDENWLSYLPEKKPVVIENNHYSSAANYGYSQLTNNKASWQTASVTLAMKTPEKHYAHVTLDQKKRFNLDDWQIDGSYALPYKQKWNLYIGATYSPTHRFLASWSLDAKIGKQLADGFNLHAGVKHAKYSDTSSQQIYLIGEQYWSDYRAAYTFKLIDVDNAGNGYNHNIQLNKYYSSGSMVAVLLADGEDVEFDGSPNPPISNVLTLSLFGQYSLKPQWWLNYSLTYHEQGTFYNLNGFTLGIKFDY